MDTTEGRVPIRRALVSVYDKSGLEELVRGLHAAGVALVSTGGSAALIEGLGIPVTKVEELTGFPECLDGRVKTLHPKVHAGILADRRLESHVQQLEELGIEPFDLVVSNLYPFRQTVLSGASPDECVEQIDIGGPSMVRAAAKNHPSVAIVTSPARYADVLAAVAAGGFTLAQRQGLAAEAFQHTATYDVAVASWMGSVLTDTSEGTGFPAWTGATWEKAAVAPLRREPAPGGRALPDQSSLGSGGLASAEQLHGKEMSYNNYVDTDAARRAANDFAEPAVAIIKHANPCGIAVGADVAEAYRRANECDPTSAFGGVIAVNRPVSVAMAEQLRETFTEAIVAPAYDDGAVEVLQSLPRGGKNIRILVCAARRAPGPRGVPRDQRRRPDAAASTTWTPTGDDPATLDAGDRRGGPGRRAGRPGLRLAGLPGGEVQRDPARPRRRVASASAWARSTGSTPAAWPSPAPATGPRARWRRPTRSSRSRTAPRSSSTPASVPSCSPAGRCATSSPSRRPRPRA